MPSRRKPAPPPAAPPAAAPAVPDLQPEPAPEPEAAEVALEQIKDVRQLSTAVIEEMIRLIPPSRIAQEIETMLTAKRWVGKGENMRQEPDLRAREIGLRYWFSYGIGLPVQRQEIVSTHMESESQVMARARLSPATRAAMRAELDQMDADDAGS